MGAQTQSTSAGPGWGASRQRTVGDLNNLSHGGVRRVPQHGGLAQAVCARKDVLLLHLPRAHVQAGAVQVHCTAPPQRMSVMSVGLKTCLQSPENWVCWGPAKRPALHGRPLAR